MDYCDTIKFSDGSSVLERFQTAEQELEKQIQAEMEAEALRKRKYNIDR